MKKMNLVLRVVVAATTLGLLLPVAQAEKLPDADAREVARYALTEAGLTQYLQATRNLSGIRVEQCDDDNPDVPGIAQAAARIDAVPGAKAAVQSAGMTSREYVVFAFSLLQNGIAAYKLQTPGGTLPPEVSMSNVEFYQKHSGVLAKLAEETEDESCENDDND